MKTVMESLFRHYRGSSLFNRLSGRVLPISAPSGTEYPFVIVSIISELPTYGFDSESESILIEVSVFSLNITEMHELSEMAFKLFNGIFLEGLVGYRQVGPMDRDFSQPIKDGEVFRYLIEYRLNLQKQG